MIRIYLNKTIEVLDIINVSHHEYIFIRQLICWQAYNLMSEFCSETNVELSNQLFEKMRFIKNYFSDCFFIKKNMSIIRKRINFLVMILKEKFPDVKAGFYLSKRKEFLHMGLDKSFTSIEC